jgi:hypothetical protein
MVEMEPRTCAAMRVKVMWKRVMVCSKIMPNPTPCSASRTPSQSQRQRPRIADAAAEPAQGRYWPAADVPHSIWHHLGAPRPIANTGRIQECDFDNLERKIRNPAQTMTKKTMTRRAIAQAGACCVVQRYFQFLP